ALRRPGSVSPVPKFQQWTGPPEGRETSGESDVRATYSIAPYRGGWRARFNVPIHRTKAMFFIPQASDYFGTGLVPVFSVDVPPHVAEVIRHLPPEVKQGVKAPLRAITEDPDIGEPLRRELEGLWKFRVRRFRLVYEVDRGARVVRVVAVGHRRGIYEEVAARVRRP